MPASSIKLSTKQFVGIACLASLAILTTPCAAQEHPAEQQLAANQSSPTSDEIIVHGQRLQEAITNFVDQVSVLPRRSENQLAAWDQNQTLCPGIAGLHTRYAEFVIDRMAQRALDVGVDFGEPGCRANILIIVSLDPGSVAQDLVEHHPLAMGAVYDDRALHKPQSQRALQAFEHSTAPVRWWHVTHTVGSNGQVMVVGSTNATTDASRLHRTTAQRFGVAFVIVDARRLPDIDSDFGALADYLAMVVLAPIDPAANTSRNNTILNLFDHSRSDEPHTLTEWDLAYLRGTYAATANARNAQQQRSEIAQAMNASLAPATH